MASNISFDENLLNEALKLGGFRYKKDVINEALKEYVSRKKQTQIIGLFGTIDFDPAYDHKRARQKRR